MRILVTGGSGFTGRRVLPHLAAAGHEVVALSRSATAEDVVRRAGATPLPGDLDDSASLEATFRAAASDALVNLASLGFGHGPAVIAAAEHTSIRRAVFLSTTAVTTTLAASSKSTRLAAEAAIAASTLDWTILRPTMIYGGRDDRNMARLLSYLRRWPVVVVPGRGDRLQQPVHVDDLAAAVVSCLSRPETVGRTYDVAGPEPITFRRVIEEAAGAVGRRPRLVTVPLGPAVWMARRYEHLSRRPRLRAEQLLRLDEDKAFDVGLARADLGFDPRPFAVGIRQQV